MKPNRLALGALRVRSEARGRTAMRWSRREAHLEQCRMDAKRGAGIPFGHKERKQEA